MTHTSNERATETVLFAGMCARMREMYANFPLFLADQRASRKVATSAQKAFSVLQFAKTESAITVQRAFRIMFDCHPPKMIIIFLGCIISFKLAVFVKRKVRDDQGFGVSCVSSWDTYERREIDEQKHTIQSQNINFIANDDPTIEQKGCAAFYSRWESISGENPTSFPIDTPKPYLGFEPEPTRDKPSVISTLLVGRSRNGSGLSLYRRVTSGSWAEYGGSHGVKGCRGDDQRQDLAIFCGCTCA
ncbi:DUF4817 domain-containing protein [Trichonephila clavipes]|nr:DUF4817 domain-containing protein [Trichonephila clavipes]